jgi:hypothetical protein
MQIRKNGLQSSEGWVSVVSASCDGRRISNHLQCGLDHRHAGLEESRLWRDQRGRYGGFVPSSKSWTSQAWNGRLIPQGMVPEE